MKVFYTLLLGFLSFCASSQTVDVSGACVSGTINLVNSGPLDGKDYYEAYGTVMGIAGVQVDVYWSSTDNLWILAFDGQPYFTNGCDFTKPPGTGASCDWLAVSGMDCTGGTALSISGDVILPVYLNSFTGSVQGNRIILNWSASAEVNNRDYEMQRSGDGRNWISLGSRSGAGNSSELQQYSLTDYQPLTGKNYYRLLQHDFDGRTSYLKTIAIDYQPKGRGYYSLSGDAATGMYRLQVLSGRPLQYTVTDLSGKTLFSREVSSGTHNVDLGSYAAGVYMLRLRQDGQFFTEKLIKE